MSERMSMIVGLVSATVMTGNAASAVLRDHPRADAVVAHGLFAAIPIAAILLYHWFPARVLWGFLVPALMGTVAGVRELEPFWGYAVAGVLGVWTAARVTPPSGHDDVPRYM